MDSYKFYVPELGREITIFTGEKKINILSIAEPEPIKLKNSGGKSYTIYPCHVYNCMREYINYMERGDIKIQLPASGSVVFKYFSPNTPYIPVFSEITQLSISRPGDLAEFNHDTLEQIDRLKQPHQLPETVYDIPEQYDLLVEWECYYIKLAFYATDLFNLT